MTTLASFSRGTLPAEFYDVTSRLLLKQPEAQHFYYLLLSTALGASFAADNTEVLPLAGREIVTGGDPNYINLDEMQLELEPSFDYSDTFEVDTSFKQAPGGMWQPGHTVRMNRPRFTDSSYTFASREISTGKVISKTPIAVGSDQTELTIKRYGGPYDVASGEIRPFSINRLDAQRSVHSLAAVRKLHFTRDYHKTLDAFGVQLLDTVATGNVFWAAGMTDDNSAVAVNDFPFSYELLTRMKLRLDDTNIPVFPNGKRPCVVSPLQAQQLGRDPEFQRLAVFAPPKNPLLAASYYKSVLNIDIFQSTTLTRAANVNSIKIHYAQMFGPGAIGAAPGNMPEVATNSDDNYGEDVLAIWKQYFALGVLDDRFSVSGRSSGEHT